MSDIQSAPVRMGHAGAGAGAGLAGAASLAYPPRASVAPPGGAFPRLPTCIIGGLSMNDFAGYSAIVDLANRGGDLPDISGE